MEIRKDLFWKVEENPKMMKDFSVSRINALTRRID